MLAQISMSAPLGRGNLIHHSPYLFELTLRPGEKGGTDMLTFPIIWSLVIYGRFQQKTGHLNLTKTAKGCTEKKPNGMFSALPRASGHLGIKVRIFKQPK